MTDFNSILETIDACIANKETRLELYGMISSEEADKLLEKVYGLDHLEELHIEDMEIDDPPMTSVNLTPELYNLSNLKKLIINSTLTELPAGISKLKNLTHLELRGHSDEPYPTEIFELTELRSLTVATTQEHEGFPIEVESEGEDDREHIGNLSKLEHLDLSECQDLYSLPKVIVQCTALKSINLQNTSLKEKFPDGFSDLPNLEEVDIRRSGNRMWAEKAFTDEKWSKVIAD